MEKKDLEKLQEGTKLAHAGRKPEKYCNFVNPPIYHSSTVLFPTLDNFDEAQKETYTGYTYMRVGNPTAEALQGAVDSIEGGKSIIVSSGIGAVSTALLSHLGSGDHLLMTDSVYGPTRKLCLQELTRFGIEVSFYDPMIGAGIKEHMRPNTKVVFTESPGSLTFEVQDIPAIAEVAHKAGATVIMDNSWATPLYYKALEKGVDVVVHSATKYINGHSDVVIGIISCNEKSYPKVYKTHRAFGATASPTDCYYTQRGIRTLAVRLKHHEQSALKVAEWLKGQSIVTKVLHPAFKECPGHEIWKRDYKGSSGLFSFLLKPHSREQLAKMMDGMLLLKMGYSWGGFESLMIPFIPGSVRTATKWNHDGINLRLSCGLEDPDDIIQDLKDGFKRLAS